TSSVSLHDALPIYSTVCTLRPAAAAPSTRHAQTSSPSIRTEQDPHSPCSHAFLLPARPRLSRKTVSRLSWSAASASLSSPFTVSLILTGCPRRAREP